MAFDEPQFGQFEFLFGFGLPAVQLACSVQHQDALLLDLRSATPLPELIATVGQISE